MKQSPVAAAPRLWVGRGMEALEDSLGPVIDVKLAINVPNMSANRPLGHTHLFRDFFVEQSTSEECQHLDFGRRELFVRRGRAFARLPKTRHDETRDLAGHGRAPAMQLLDRFKQLKARRFLEDVTISAGGQRFKDALMVLKDGQHHDLGARKTLSEFGSAGDPGHAAHLNIHQDNIRRAGRRDAQRLLARGTGGNAFETGGGVQKANDMLAIFAAV